MKKQKKNPSAVGAALGLIDSSKYGMTILTQIPIKFQIELNLQTFKNVCEYPQAKGISLRSGARKIIGDYFNEG